MELMELPSSSTFEVTFMDPFRYEKDNTGLLLLVAGIPEHTTIYLHTGYVDLRKSVSGFVNIIENEYGMNSRSRSLFLFCGRRANKIKILYHGADGYLLATKECETGRYYWPRQDQCFWKISAYSLYKLLSCKKLDDIDRLRVIPRL